MWLNSDDKLVCVYKAVRSALNTAMYTHKSLSSKFFPHMEVMFNVDQWQTQGILHCNK